MQATTARERTGTKFTSLSTHRLKTKAKCFFFFFSRHCSSDVICQDFPLESRSDARRNLILLKLFALPYAVAYAFALGRFGNDIVHWAFSCALVCFTLLTRQSEHKSEYAWGNSTRRGAKFDGNSMRNISISHAKRRDARKNLSILTILALSFALAFAFENDKIVYLIFFACEFVLASVHYTLYVIFEECPW